MRSLVLHQLAIVLNVCTFNFHPDASDSILVFGLHEVQNFSIDDALHIALLCCYSLTPQRSPLHFAVSSLEGTQD